MSSIMSDIPKLYLTHVDPNPWNFLLPWQTDADLEAYNRYVATHPNLEVFTFQTDTGHRYAWDVRAAWRMIGARKPMVVSVDTFTGNLPNMVFDAHKAMSHLVDLNVPVLVSPNPLVSDLCILIDGWHRVYKAAALGYPDLWCHMLTTDEMVACMIPLDDERLYEYVDAESWGKR